ncbi:hypothetical protein [Candidatus Poriferisodalis sp.]|uniref:hypothetical protein n=1 Tax=Candidatus Poriferisodalis sp. TaxID=3101277 RepID=UPI003B0199C8
MAETQQQAGNAIMSNVDIAQIISTVGLLFATLVLVGIEYQRWRPVIALSVRYLKRHGDWHAVLEIKNVGGSAASDVVFEFDDIETQFVNHPNASRELSMNLRYDVLVPDGSKYVYLSQVHVRHSKDEEHRQKAGRGSTFRSQTYLDPIKGKVSHRVRFAMRRSRSFVVNPDPKWWLGEIPDFSKESLDSVLLLNDQVKDYNFAEELIPEMKKMGLGEDDD